MTTALMFFYTFTTLFLILLALGVIVFLADAAASQSWTCAVGDAKAFLTALATLMIFMCTNDHSKPR